ncbi:Serine/threonine-protein kinase ppk4 [Grifola frondosa]|uniref:non-specific serine/threonine protein kinase n=1 Tax=Grifola frondosa TaxID=5627 RepID=A0A1C7MNY1_GRIFR|nr:Serine/threonine-protein kinase ppk4 [Grifola frondosa]
MALSSVLSAFLIFAVACLAEVISLRSAIGNRVTDLSTHVQLAGERVRFAPGGGDNDLDLLDIVLVASVDGKLHALNRTSGASIWSMASSASAAPATLGPLVRTQHPDIDPDLTDDDSPHQEVYAIEPQSGDIYVMSSPDSPLQRLPFSMSQLVDMSPFSFSGDEDRRVFVGRKETSLLLVELETGRVKATTDAECPWDPFEDMSEITAHELDLDELDGTKPPKLSSKSTEVFIGRTDDTYIQSLPNGKIISFKTAQADLGDTEMSPNAHLMWYHVFSNPIVATFDVVRSRSHPDPFVLLQPQPHLQDIMPSVDLGAAAKFNQLPNLDAAPDRFPLVVFGDANFHSPHVLDPPSAGADGDLPADVDSVARMRRLRELCKAGGTDLRCLTGVRKLGSSSQSRLSRLLDGVPSAALPPNTQGDAVREGHLAPNVPVDNVSGNASISPLHFYDNISRPSIGESTGHLELGTPTQQMMSAFVLSVFALLSYLVWVVVRRRTRGRKAVDMPESQEPKSEMASNTDVVLAEDTPTAVSSPSALVDEAPAQNAIDHINADSSLPAMSDPDSLDAVPDVVDEDTEKEGEVGDTPGKRKAVRRKRGKKKKGLAVTIVVDDGDEDKEKDVGPPPNANDEAAQAAEGQDEFVMVNSSPNIVVPTTPKPTAPTLIVSDAVLGLGSHGTVVYKGSLQGRAVAVKRLLRDFVTLASREVAILQESDDHPNVIRYYYQEAHADFLYIALELCPASLADIVERPDQFREIAIAFEPKRALRQITSGLRHLHALKIIHRDIKPQNILISDARRGVGEYAGRRMLISDFGLCRRLEVDQTSFLPTAHGAAAAGTAGWRAPEILCGEVKLDDAGDDSQSSRSSTGTQTGGSPGGRPRLTKSVDIFALGCLYYYVLTNGGHPFGDRYERDFNILKDAKNLEGLARFGEEGSEGVDLISQMLSPQACDRPDTSTCLLHPYFWDPGKRLTFLQDASDRFEIMCRDPKDPNLVALETGASKVVGADWHSRLDKLFIENLGKFRKYDGRSVQDLLRALRNKKHHYQDLPENVKRLLGSMPEGFLAYFTRRFPLLFMHVHSAISASPLRSESMFRTYFELHD